MCHFLVLSMKSCTQRKLNNYISILMTCCSEDIKVDFLKLLFLLLWNDKNAVCTLNSVTNTCWHVILISLGLGPCTHLQISCTRVTTLKSTCSVRYLLLKKKFIYPCILLWANQRLMESKGLMEHDLKSNKIHVLVLITNAKIVKICLKLLIIFLLIYKQTVEFFVMSVFAKCSFDHAIKAFLSFFQNVNLASINGC